MSSPSLSPSHSTTTRYFLTYRGVKLPLQFTEELQPDALRNRNTWFQVDYDKAGRIVRAEKKVYGETEMSHEYSWSADGRLLRACIVIGDEEPQVVNFPA